jgi:hypothetical protein
MVMEAVGSAATAVGEALGLVKPDKAKLVCVPPNLPDGAGPHEVACSFNPTDYTLTQTVDVPGTSTPSKAGGQQQYAGTKPMTFATNLFFDAFSEVNGDVTPAITQLLSWTRPTPKSHQDGRDCPPLVQFKWGGNPQLEQFKGFITNLTIKYTLFRKDGTPVRAEVAIQITGQTPTQSGPNPTSRAANSRRVHQVIDGDTLQSVAYRELGKPTYWRAIAELNGIDDPMRVTPGTALLIPSLADATRGG